MVFEPHKRSINVAMYIFGIFSHFCSPTPTPFSQTFAMSNAEMKYQTVLSIYIQTTYLNDIRIVGSPHILKGGGLKS